MGFDDFWAIGIHKTGKRNCRRIFAAVTSPSGYHTKYKDKTSGKYFEDFLKATSEEIIAGWKAYYIQELDGETPNCFVCHPATFLNQGRWEDFDDTAEAVARYDRLKARLRVVG